MKVAILVNARTLLPLVGTLPLMTGILNTDEEKFD